MTTTILVIAGTIGGVALGAIGTAFVLVPIINYLGHENRRLRIERARDAYFADEYAELERRIQKYQKH